MDGKIIVFLTDVHRDAGKAKLGVMVVADALGVKRDFYPTRQAWLISINRSDQTAFLDLAREEAESA